MSHWPGLGHTSSPKAIIDKGERAGLQADPHSVHRTHPEHSLDSVGRKMGGSGHSTGNQPSCQALLGFLFFLASVLFLTRDIILSKQVSHHALLTEAWWLINTSIQIPRETQMPGWDEARKCSAALGRV